MNQDELSADTASLRAKVTELQELKAKYESMVEAFDGQIYICSSDYRVEFMNRRLIERTGRDAVGEVCYKALHELESVCPWCVNERVFRGETVRWEVLSPKDHRSYYIVNTPIHHPDGSVSKMAMIQDITERKQAEERLRLLDFALDRLREAVFLTDEAARFRFVNEESCRGLGYTRTELLGLGVSDVDHDFPPDRWLNHWEDLKAKGSLMFEGRHKTKDGRVFPVEINANYFEYAGQGYNLALVRDITARKQEENVMLARLRLMKFADTHTLEELLQATLDEAEALTGSLIGFYHFVDSDQRSLWLQSWSTRTLRDMCTAEGKGLHYDVNEAGVWVDCVHQRKPVIHNDYSALPHRRGMPVGHAKVTRELVVPVFRTDRIVAILGVGNKPVDYVQDDVEIVSLLADLAWDVAERKMADENLRRSEAKFLDLYENAPCAYLSVGTDGIIRLSNQRCGELLGYSREELIGKPVFELYADQPGGKGKAEQIFKRFLAGEPIADEELLMQKADGSPLWISLTVNGVRDSDGHLVESRSMVLDISERKQAEEAHRRLTRELRAISECNQTLLRAVDEQPLINDICRIICTEAGYRLAWVAYTENDDAKTIRPVAWAGVEEGYFADARLTWADTECGRGPSGTAIREGKSSCIQDFTTDPRAMPWREKAMERGCRSCIALPLKDESENTFGILCIYSTEPNAFTLEEIRLLEELAGDLAFGLIVLRTRVERDLAEEALAIRNRINEIFLTYSGDEMYPEVLAVILETMQSKYGVFAYIDEQGAAIAPSMTRDIWEKCLVPEKSIVFPMDTWGHSIWAQAMTEKRSIYANKSFAVPKGHIPINRALDVPILYQGEVIGHFLVGNKETDYDDRDREKLEGIARSISAILSARIQEDRQEQRRRQAEEELKGLTLRYEMILNSAGEGIYGTDIDGNIVFMNQAALNMLGLTMSEAIGKNSHETFHHTRADGKPYPIEECPLHYALSDKRTVRAEDDVFWTKSGKMLYVEHVNAPLVLNGVVVGAVIVFRDITEAKQAEQALRESEQRYRTVADFTYDWEYWVTEKGRLLYVSPSCERITGYSAQEFLDDPGLVERIVHKDDLDDVKNHFHVGRGVDHELSYSLDFRILHRDGRIVWVNHACRPVFGKDGEPLGRRACNRDITERKRAEEERLARLQFIERMDKVNRALQGTNDLDQMMQDVLEAVLAIFDCDRSWLLHPCDPDAPSFRVPLAATKPQYPGAKTLSAELPLSPDMAQNLLEALESAGPVTYAEGTDKPVDKVSADRFGVKSMMTIALYPKVGKPWVFGLHQCSHARVWTSDEKELFREIGRRLTDGLSALLAYRNLCDNMGKLEEAQRIGHLGYWDRDMAGNRITLSDEACRIFGLSSDEPVVNLELWHERWLALVHPEDRHRVSQTVVKALTSGPRYNVEYRIVRPDGEVRHIHSEANVTRDESGHAIRMLGMMQDITEHKLAAEAVSRANKDWEQTFNAIPDMVMVLDTHHRILRANKAMAAVLGLSEKELKGRSCFELVHGENLPPVFCPHSALLKDGKEHSTEFFEPRLGRSLDIRVSPFSDETGTVIGSVHVARDVSQQKSLQKQLLQAQKMESIGTLAGGIAHDFNNLLQVILGYSEMLLFGKKPTDSDYERLHAIREAGKDGAELAKGILAFSRRLEPNARPIDLNNEIIRVQKMIARTIPKMIAIQIVLADNLMTVNADPSQMEQILLNLAINAQHAMPDGGRLSIETANVTLDEQYSRTHLGVEPGRYVLLTVSDTGQGMDKEVMEHIFEPFYTTKRPGEGTGLGLSMVFGIVKSHKGHITCYSEPGTGTTFKIYLPAIVQEIERDPTVSQQLPAFGTETILLVDDEESIRKLGEEMLKMAGYTVVTATNGIEALEVYRANQDRIALVLLDLIMPEMGGKQCLEELRKINSRAKVVIASGYSANGPTKDALGAGAKAFINKPYDMRQVLTVVRTVLDAE